MERDCHGQRSEEVEPGNQEAQEDGSREGEIRRGHRLQSNLEDAGSTVFETEIRPIGGGIPAGYYLPTKIAGPMNAAIGLTDFPSLSADATFREKMAADTEGLEIRRRVEASGAILNEERSFLSCVPESRR